VFQDVLISFFMFLLVCVCVCHVRDFFPLVETCILPDNGVPIACTILGPVAGCRVCGKSVCSSVVVAM